MTEKKYQRYYDLAVKASFENWESVRDERGACQKYLCLG